MTAMERTFTKPYLEAITERMETLPDQADEEEHSDDDDDDDDTSSSNYCHPRRTTSTTTCITLTLTNDEVVGTSVSGVELLRMPPVSIAVNARSFKEQVAQTLEEDADMITLLSHDGEDPIADDELIGGISTIVLKLVKQTVTVFVCRKSSKRFLEPSLGEGTLHWNLQANCDMIQGLQENRDFVTQLEGFCWHIYSKDRVWVSNCRRDNPVIPIGIFPQPPPWPLPPSSRNWGGARCDVWSASVDLPTVRPLLNAHASRTMDRPIPRYQMIIDPNQFVRDVDGQAVWVPCEFDVKADGSVLIVGGERSHAQPSLAKRVAEPVLEAALPLLAQLRRPQLLLDDRRLQVVFKAQRIIVPPKVSETSDAEYVGLWHVDGYREHIAAVVLYYYNVDSGLQGGDMEFLGREPMDVLGFGDCDNNYNRLSKTTLHKALREVQDAGRDTILQNCRVPIREGTLLVFSNYQMVHRVLRMVNNMTESEASRDFVALFIIDPAAKPLLPARCHLAQSYMVTRTLKAWVPSNPVAMQMILEFMGELPSECHRYQKRAEMLLEQLKPQGDFVGQDRAVYATGNGCYTMIGWLHHMLGGNTSCRFVEYTDVVGWPRFRALDMPPKKLNRGMSELLSLPSDEIESRRVEYDEEQAVIGQLLSPP